MDLVSTLIDELQSHHLPMKRVELKRNQFLKVKGSIDTNLYFVEEGSLRIYLIDDQEEHTIRFGYQNNIIAALDSFINEKPSDLYIQALRKSSLKIIKKSDFRQVINSSPENIQRWLQVLEDFTLQQMERERDILTNSPQERYRRVLARSPQLFQEVPHKYIASYLRMTPETLSRIKKS